MRSFVTGWMVAASVIALVSGAWAANQDVAEQIARDLRQSGQMHDYKIGVKYQEGTAWLVGRVTSEQQLTTALNVVMQSPHVERVVNNLSVSAPEPFTDTQTPKLPGPHRQAGDSQLRIGAVHDVGAQPAAAKNGASQTGGGRGGLTTAQRLQRAVNNHLRGNRSQSASDAAAPEGANQADRVPASFEPAPARPTSAAHPTLAAPTPAQQASQQQAPQQQAPQQPAPQTRVARRPVPVAYTQPHPHAGAVAQPGMAPAGPRPMYTAAAGGGVAPARYDQPRLPNYAWPSYAAYPNYAAVTYPKQYSPTAWPYIGPFYPYPQVPLGWRKVSLEWDNGWWMLDFKDR